MYVPKMNAVNIHYPFSHLMTFECPNIAIVHPRVAYKSDLLCLFYTQMFLTVGGW